MVEGTELECPRLRGGCEKVVVAEGWSRRPMAGKEIWIYKCTQTITPQEPAQEHRAMK